MKQYCRVNATNRRARRNKEFQIWNEIRFSASRFSFFVVLFSSSSLKFFRSVFFGDIVILTLVCTHTLLYCAPVNFNYLTCICFFFSLFSITALDFVKCFPRPFFLQIVHFSIQLIKKCAANCANSYIVHIHFFLCVFSC